MTSTLSDLLPILEAEAELKRLNLGETMAVLAASANSYSVQQLCIQRYQKLFGILPEQREEYRSRLEQIRAGSRETVARVRRLLHASGESSSGSAS
jgi:hypothetical protein